MKVLIIDNTLDQDSWGSSALKSFVTKSKDRTAFVRRAPHGDLPKDIRNFDRVIISGSRTSCLEEGGWISDLDRLLRDALTAKKPVLGVCYGHQALNRVLGGKSILRKAATPEFGWTEIEVLEKAPLFSGLPEKFWSFSAHFEEIATLPKGMKLIARSADCAIQACQLGDLPVYGIQFHPERNLSVAKTTIGKWRQDGKKVRLKFDIRHGDASEKLFNAEVGDQIFENFLSGK